MGRGLASRQMNYVTCSTKSVGSTVDPPDRLEVVAGFYARRGIHRSMNKKGTRKAPFKAWIVLSTHSLSQPWNPGKYTIVYRTSSSMNQDDVRLDVIF